MFLLLKFDNSSPSHAYELMTHYHLRRSTQWNHLNEVYLQSKFAVDWRYSYFQTGHFAEFKQFKVDIHFADIGQVTIDPTHSLFLTLDRSQLFYWVWVKQAAKNNPNRHCLIKNSRTTHRIWYKSFSMIQSAGIKNWGPQSIKRLQSFSLLFLFVTRFSDFCDNKICMLRIKIQKVLHIFLMGTFFDIIAKSSIYNPIKSLWWSFFEKIVSNF